jgi:hypothetical protein
MRNVRHRARERQAALAASRRAQLSRALDTEAAPSVPTPPTAAAPAPPRCDRSGDVGSTHYFREGAVVGDWCLCGKRRRFTPFS